jgi:predicted DNA-binding transcriptional regulator AlpA
MHVPCENNLKQDDSLVIDSTNIVGTSFISGETGLHIRQVQRLAKKGKIPKAKRFGLIYGWLYSDVKDFIEAHKTKPLDASNDPAY